MKKFLLASVLLSLSVLMQAMDDKKLVVRMGGYSGYGAREYQEDRFVCGVIKHKNNEIYCTLVADGHGGDKVACLLQARFLPFVQRELQGDKSLKESLFNARTQCEELALQEDSYKSSGSTLLVSCFNPKNKKLHVLWVGDSRAAFGGSVFYPTHDHKPTKKYEKKRIEEAGGVISDAGKLHGIIGVSRSIGDKLFKDRYKSLISDPDYVEYEMKVEDTFYIGASDGFWDVVKNEEIMNLIEDAQDLSEENFYEKHCHGFNYDEDDTVFQRNNRHIVLTNDFENKDAARIARRLLHVAFYRGSKDNITVVVNFLGNKEFVVQSMSESDESYEFIEEEELATSEDQDIKSEDFTEMLQNLNGFPVDKTEKKSDRSIDGEDCGSNYSRETVSSDSDSEGSSSTSVEEEFRFSSSSSELGSFEFPEKIEPVITQAPWKVFIQNHKYKIGGLAAMLAIIFAAYKYNYLHLNYMTV